MTDEGNGARIYELTCGDCSFETQFEGDIDELFDHIENHQDEKQGYHFVAFQSDPA